MRARPGLFAAVSLTLLVAACGGNSKASPAPTATSTHVSDIASVGMMQSDVPSEYAPLKVKIYRHYARVLKIGTGVTSSASTSCSLPQSVSSKSFRQGLIAVLENKQLSGFLECSYVLSNILSARKLYASFKKGFHQQTIFRLVTRAPKVGNESTTLSTAKSTGIAGYSVTFRHANAVISIAFVSFGSPKVTLNTVEHLAATINTRVK